MQYAELFCRSNFSFLHSASHPEELVDQADDLGYDAIAITDECSLAGVVKAHVAAAKRDIDLVIGSYFKIGDHHNPIAELILLAPNRDAYGQISALITKARRRSEKGHYQLTLEDLNNGLKSCLAIWFVSSVKQQCYRLAPLLIKAFPKGVWLGIQYHLDAQFIAHYKQCLSLATEYHLMMTCVGNIRMHHRDRQPLLDVLTAIRQNTTLTELGLHASKNRECALQNLQQIHRRFPEALIKESIHIAQQCHFSLDELRYNYPAELVPSNKTPSEWLSELVHDGCKKRWPEGANDQVTKQIKYELNVIRELKYEHYFLTVHDIVQFARSQHILCQGRGSAANSAVCYALFITEVDPAQSNLLFERFISKERNEPPDIDVDFEHHRREEVIQYIYKKYGRDRAALAATVITYRPRSAIRDVGKAIGLDAVVVNKLAKSLAWWDRSGDLETRLGEANLSTRSPITKHYAFLIKEILGMPRHLSQHVGGFIVTDAPVYSLVPIENAAMEGRTIIQWDKDDIEALGLLKIDVLALGMLSAIQKSLAAINVYSATPVTLASIPADCPKTYGMLSRGDSIGVFQVESRAQMNMLPRLQPNCFYDLVIEVALVRPGPIQGDMVHPYLRRRQGLEQVDYANEAVQAVLERTLGVPIFQEQVIKLAMVAAGFSGGQADQLRRAMANWRRNGELAQFKEPVITGMLERGHSLDFAERLFRQMEGFGDYGFPESHAASFALLVYISAWLKCHYPAAFYCGLLNSQPMGFYSPSQLLQDAKRHGVDILPIDINHSHWDYQLEVLSEASPLRASQGSPQISTDSAATITTQSPSLRVGFRQIKGFSKPSADEITSRRLKQLISGANDAKKRCKIASDQLEKLIAAGAFNQLDGNKHLSHWLVQGVSEAVLTHDNIERTKVSLAEPSPWDQLADDYQHTGITLNQHPLWLLQETNPINQCTNAQDCFSLHQGRWVQIAGIVSCRQRPSTASGLVFLTLEDHTGNHNVIVEKAVQERCRKALLAGQLLHIKGVIERVDPPKLQAHGETSTLIHIKAGHIEDISHLLNSEHQSRDFH
ncbi:error-prone DNA polymerase [Umboniibacter marinipuniceus]|uniref:Error-prone DNA polymerase n=1 Tax=Umboniibacter marinipuniceus TaxID=569599 RepID=A0A3M0A9X0_9GAMM|nr:error-prone DNA polymerase [Umboniibacter marinipuniceus]RMA81337.1 error-prone DNA polymerase [Umboniibacter marinipuniceus]